ncbi:hypothetical protein JCM33374_g2285 [Metschnikowia sp. JCM 33374]|nr:hypothetical protein JCM33374_g2285 [Metschnikowia sp. JCM 33374]
MTLLSRVLNHHSEKTPRGSRTSSFSKSSGIASLKRKSSPVSLNINLESPPVVLYGHAHESTGSLISGVLTLEIHPPKTSNSSSQVLSPQVSSNGLQPQMSATSITSSTSLGDSQCLTPTLSNEAGVEIDSVVLSLIQTVHYTKPFMVSSNQISSCKSCATRKNTLAQWDVLSSKASFPVGQHAYPFSHLLPGSLAASSKLGSTHSYTYIKYDLVAVAKSGSRDTTVILPVNVSRSILRGPDRNSLRVFPPTEVTANAVLPGVMYPKSTFPIELRMGHVVNTRQDRRWRMRKLSWKLEEHTQIAAYACEEHAPKIKSIQDSQKKAQISKRLRAGASPKQSASGGSGDGPSKSNGMHHSTIQSSMFVSLPPTNPHGAIRAAALDTSEQAGDQDIVEPDEETPTNRVMDEVVHFEEDFGNPENLEGGSSSQEASSSNIAAATSSSAIAASVQNGPQNQQPGLYMEEEANKETLFLDELRVVAHGDIKSGWKSDFSGDGTIDLVAEISALECSSGLRNDANISCDINDPVLGIYVGHVLVLEVIVAEEIVSQPKHQHIPKESLTPVSSVNSVASGSNLVGVPTGAARVLRMQFKVVMTERSGLGIAWDDEVPPMYEDVRALSPPTYETSAIGTPNSGYGLSPSISGQRSAPTVIYGLGDTPVVGSFVPNRAPNNIDAMTDLDEAIQEFRL